MKKSERITYIKEVSRRLAPEEWSDIDLTLKQFGLPWTDSWNGKKLDYVIEMVEGASDDVLLELAAHLGFGESFDQTQEATFWAPGRFRMFISHISAKKHCAARLQMELEKFAISGFVAHADIAPTRQWQREIELALNTMDAITALLHEGFKESNWTDQEIGVAIGRRVLVIPIKVDLDPYGFIGMFQAIQGAGMKTSTIAEKIFSILLQHGETSLRITEAAVEKFIASGSYAEAKSNVELLSNCPKLTGEMKEKIAEAAKSNSQIRDAFGVPEKVQRLVV